MNNKKSISILMADDDEDDRFLLKKGFDAAKLNNPLKFVVDGQDLLDYLKHEGNYTHLTDADLPGIILLDLNMPKKDGREALKEIKADPKLRRIPIVILTTSKAEEDIVRTYDLGAASYIAKPVTFPALMETVQAIGKYWFDIVELR